MEYYVVKYTGPFGFIKPWTAVRDSETFSQQFLTPSIIAGMERKLFPKLLQRPYKIYNIKGHRLTYTQMAGQQEQIQSRGWNKLKVDRKPAYVRESSILTRSVLLNPTLFLAFGNPLEAEVAARQHICCCRNEDILYPMEIIRTTADDFETNEDLFAGFELKFESSEKSFLVGYNRYDNGSPMYGWLKVLGNPINSI